MHVLPSFNALRAFEAAVRRGSFVAAANELHLTPSAVSHQVKLLEDQLGFSFSVGSGVPSSRPIAASATTGRSRPRSAGSRRRRWTSPAAARATGFRCTRHRASPWLLPRLPEFVAAHPELDVVFWATSPPYNLMASNCDIDIQYGATRHRGPGRHALPNRARRPHVQSGSCPRHPADPLCRGSSILSSHPFRSLSRSLAGLAGTPPRPLARSRSGIALRPVIHVDLDGRGRPRRVSRQYPSRPRGGQAAVW